MAATVLKKLNIKRFRALRDVEIEFGTQLTVICGKNGTSKSSILGIAAQIFSFEKDYVKGDSLNFRTIAGTHFKSLPKEHFRFSDDFDVAGSLEVGVELYDGYTEREATAELELSKRGSVARPVVRKNSVSGAGNASRNFTHPVIFLGLGRLFPIASRDYVVADFDYLRNAHKRRFIELNNELLNKESSAATGTRGTVHSAVAHTDAYDQNSVSAGEDNSGQIILALMSFRKLKEEYADYKGGLLLIDEADASLFPAAQRKLIEILVREAQQLNLQIILTSHSPTLIEHVFELSRRYPRRHRTVYLSDTFGDLKAMNDMSWDQISADLLTKTVALSDTAATRLKAPQVNVYFEDREAFEFFKAIMSRQPANRYLHPLPDISMGCTNYVQLARNHVPEFAEKSLVILDADAKDKGVEPYHTIVLLPGGVPPDQLIFEYLYNLPRNAPLWVNSLQFTRSNFTQSASQVIRRLGISGGAVSRAEFLDAVRAAQNDGEKPALRDVFKAFYKDPEFRSFLNLKGKENPWKHWILENSEECDNFRKLIYSRLRKIMLTGFKFDPKTIFPDAS